MNLTERVNELVAEVATTHRYSMGRIYGLYNEVFGTAESPQACASCLVRKVNQMRNWLAEQQVDNVSKPKIKTHSKKTK